MEINQRVRVTFHMIDYFQTLYHAWEINDFDQFYSSLSPKYNRDMIFKAGEGAGKSGSFFFFSHDRKFVVKTMSSTELKLFKRMVPKYADHLQANKNSLLSKILGIFTVQAECTMDSKVHIMLMENTMRFKNPNKLKYVFDLKGSTLDRIAKGKTENTTTLKDLNFLLLKQEIKNLTKLNESTTKRLIQVMRNDVAFLMSFNLMDYSMLIAIEGSNESKKDLHNDQVVKGFDSDNGAGLVKVNRTDQYLNMMDSQGSTESNELEAPKTLWWVKKPLGEWMSRRHRFQYKKRILHISIIDYLQEWNLHKKTERFYKSVILGHKKE